MIRFPKVQSLVCLHVIVLTNYDECLCLKVIKYVSKFHTAIGKFDSRNFVKRL